MCIIQVGEMQTTHSNTLKEKKKIGGQMMMKLSIKSQEERSLISMSVCGEDVTATQNLKS